jgi:CHAT domain-containing protein/tetratricopeptide (TPR) repeat protein
LRFGRFIPAGFVAVAALCTAGSSAPRSSQAALQLAVKTPPEKADLRELRRRGNVLFRAGRYVDSAAIYESGYEQAIRRGENGSALRFLNNLGSAQFKVFRYREAIKAYLRARDLAISQHDEETLAAVYWNLSSLYFQTGELEAATDSASKGLQLPPDAGAKFRSKLLSQSALIRIRNHDRDGALTLLREAVTAARNSRDTAAESESLNETGEALLDEGDLGAADQALTEAARLREANPDDSRHYTYELLADLRFRQGDTDSAFVYYDKAIASAAPFGPSASWNAFYLRGRARLAQNQPTQAYRDLAASIQCLKQSRAEVLPADAFRVSREARLDEVYSSFIEAGVKLYGQTGKRRYAEQTFAVAEENRAASLRALWAGTDPTKKLPPEYWQTLLDLRQKEVAEMTNQTGAAEAVRHARLRLTELEVQTGLDVPSYRETGTAESNSLESVRRSLAANEVFLGFHSGLQGSCVWAVAQDGFEVRSLPAQPVLAEAVARFAKSIHEGLPEAGVLGQQLYAMLLGTLSPRFRNKQVFIVAPDGPLFDLPFAALVEPQSPGRAGNGYLIERHSLRIVPGIQTVLRRPAEVGEGPFVAVGDPIYNRVDDRLGRTAQSHAATQGPTMELSRLVGSGREVEECAAIWRSHNSRTILLEGANANIGDLTEALRQNPQVVHIAAHVLFPDGGAGPGMLALTLQPGNQVQLLSTTEISSLRFRAGLVVLDGCSSGHAEILPGAGLMGLTRAWMVAGAGAVIATRWPVDDREAGNFFRVFYRRYYAGGAGRRQAVASILRETQLEQLGAGGTHAAPAYWAAYFCVEGSYQSP